MEQRRLSQKELVRIRSEDCCEKCGVKLTRFRNGIPDGPTARSMHHRQPRRDGGKDTVLCMVNLCIGCHIGIHDNEELAEQEGWIVFGRNPGHVPFLGWRGWVTPTPGGGLLSLDFDSGRAVQVVEPPQPVDRRGRKGPRYERRRTASRRRMPRVA